MKTVYEDLALGFKKDYEQVLKEIVTFEQIFKDKKWSKESRNLGKEILKTLYQQREEYGKKAEQYRALHTAPEGCKRTITFRKDRT